MNRARVLWALLLAATLCRAATELVSEGVTLFRASADVTFGAVYTDRGARVTVVSPSPTEVAIRCNTAPRNVFLGDERLGPGAWSFDPASGTVSLRVPAGTSQVHVRFDDVEDLRPYTVRVPVTILGDGDRGATEVGPMEVTVAGESARGTMAWPGPGGLFRVDALRDGRPAEGVRLASASARDAEGAVLLLEGTTLTLTGDAPGQRAPLDRVQCCRLSAVVEVRRADKAGLPWETSIVAEAESFRGEGGGEVRRSTEHADTHGGSCIYSWGAPGHWLAWEVTVPADGLYAFTFLVATQENEALRAVTVDGNPGALGVIRFPGTGGWGRSKPDEWQAFRPVDGQGNPLRVPLSAGSHEIRLTNPLGQHLNLDCILVTPAP